MAKTGFSTNNALTKKAWEEKLFRDTKKESYFSKFMGTGSESLCQEKTQLTKSKGDQITFGIRMRLQGGGVTSGQTLEGNEEKLSTYDFAVHLEEYAHAVRDAGPLDRQRAMFSIDEESQQALKDWGAEKIDQLCFNTLMASPTRVFYSDGAIKSTVTAATAKAALAAATGKITPDLLSAAKTWALTGGNRSQTPLRPVKIAGKNYFVALVHPDVMFDLQTDSTFEQARREAEVRGPENPLFTGSKAIWNGIVIHEHENVPIAKDAGSGGNEPWAHCVLMGAQSLVWAWGARPRVVSEEFDYGREHGYAWSMMAAPGKPKFNGKDYGSIALYVARTSISDAA